MKRSEFIKKLMNYYPNEDPELCWTGDGEGSVLIKEYENGKEYGYYEFETFLQIMPTCDIRTNKKFLVISSD